MIISNAVVILSISFYLKRYFTHCHANKLLVDDTKNVTILVGILIFNSLLNLQSNWRAMRLLGDYARDVTSFVIVTGRARVASLGFSNLVLSRRHNLNQRYWSTSRLKFLKKKKKKEKKKNNTSPAVIKKVKTITLIFPFLYKLERYHFPFSPIFSIWKPQKWGIKGLLELNKKKKRKIEFSVSKGEVSILPGRSMIEDRLGSISLKLVSGFSLASRQVIRTGSVFVVRFSRLVAAPVCSSFPSEPFRGKKRERERALISLIAQKTIEREARCEVALLNWDVLLLFTYRSVHSPRQLTTLLSFFPVLFSRGAVSQSTTFFFTLSESLICHRLTWFSTSHELARVNRLTSRSPADIPKSVRSSTLADAQFKVWLR